MTRHASGSGNRHPFPCLISFPLISELFKAFLGIILIQRAILDVYALLHLNRVTMLPVWLTT
ncbi:MAG: hypothetical protein KI793_11100 [Rivularia sp. (in: Bacteria)]|nr:hypothetical protein [Rivularia sp. MS3]